MGTRKRAFTLIELLVVITIIVVLLALLAPAMDKAIYQAQLAVCGTRLHATGMGLVVYTADHKRRYPHRLTIEGTQTAPFVIRTDSTSGLAPAGAAVFDDRPALRGYMPINAMFCPLNTQVDINNSQAAGRVDSNYNLWFGFRYLNQDRGMFRVGDRLVWTDSDKVRWELNILATDRNDLYKERATTQAVQSAHPDDDGVTAQVYWEDSSQLPEALPTARVTTSYWEKWGTYKRGPVDLHALVQDGSVSRYDRVTHSDPDWLSMPFWANENLYDDGEGQNIYVPKR